MSKADLFQSYLREEGYLPKVDADGDIVFKREGLTYVLFAAESDESYFRLTIPNFYSVKDATSRERVLAAAAAATTQMKVGKIAVVEDRVWASVELLIDPIENFTRVFSRCLHILTATMSAFHDALTIKH